MNHPPAKRPAASRGGETTSAHNESPARAAGGDPQLPHEHDESSHSQASATPGHDEIGRRAYRNATDGTSDTDRGPLMDEVYNDKVAPQRGPDSARR